jgi:hypothetical protein
MSNPDHSITTALRDLADQAAPPRIGVEDAWRAGRRQRRALIIIPAVALAAALTAGLLAGLPGHGTGYSPAAYVLDRAARTAAQTAPLAPRPGQYIAVTSVGTSMTEQMSPTTPRSWLTVERRKIWWPVTDSRPGINRYDAVRNEHLPWGGQPPATGLGVTWIPIPPQGCPGAVQQRDTYHFLAALPTQTAQLRAWIYAHPNGGQDADDQAWTDINDLLETTLTPPRLTAALFRVAATIPGATVVPHATDAAGRPGIAVARNIQASTEDSELIFSTGTYRLLGGRTRLTVAGKGIGPAGTVIGAWALLTKTVVSHLPRHHPGQDEAANHC